MSAPLAVALALLLLAPLGARADDPLRTGPLPPPGSEPTLPVLPPPMPTPSTLDSERRVLEMDRALRDAQREQRRSFEEQDVLDRQDLQRLEQYQIRERRADDARALTEELERRAFERPGDPPVSDAEREAQRALERQDFENRTGAVEDRIRTRQRVTPKQPGASP